MPLDGHSYLVSQGWTGSGTGLRQGAISRPLAIPQKKTLAGLGKERDEAFPFWDHLFSAASKSIQIKLDGDSDDSDAETNVNVSLKRTSTGILSNRRPVTGTTAESSGATTPDVESPSPRLSLLATAKREAAKRGLYSRFFRGPVLGPDTPVANESAIVLVQDIAVVSVSLPADIDTSEEGPSKKKKRKLLTDEEEKGKQERKRLRRERKELKELKWEKKCREKSKGKEKRKESDAASANTAVKSEKRRKRQHQPTTAASSEKKEGKRKHKTMAVSEDKRKEVHTINDPPIQVERKRKRPVE
ncbi:hypothetical protein C8R43DRAFT_539375 [Mycena crocata]|nr:hypothetical protein C8R43DRAFT_539375 [Mycena crocata]